MMAISIVTSFFLLPLLAILSISVQNAASEFNDGIPDCCRPLSRDLAGVSSNPAAKFAGVAKDLHQQIIKTSKFIDEEVAALQESSPISTRAAVACKVASLIFPGQVFTNDHAHYKQAKDYNWSQTCWLPAACIIKLGSTEDVAAVLQVIRHTQTQFAIRTGGHNPNAGWGSIDGSGILLDLSGLNDIVLKPDGVLLAGPGITWGEVYDYLDPHSLSAIGGRHATVSLPGFLTGGGMTFFPNLYGLGADSVLDFQVVLANTTIINVNAKEHSDLFVALKGGGPNFGIITRFSIQTHPLHKIQYSLQLYDASDYVNILDATVKVQEVMEEDPKIGFFLNVNPGVIIAGLLYADWPSEYPRAFQSFMDLKSSWGPYVPITNGTIASLTNSINIGDFPAKREPYAVSTKIDHELYIQVHRRYLELLQTDMPTANLSYTIQPVAKSVATAGRERGGNSLGLEVVSQSWWAPLVEWFDDASDAAAHTALNALGTYVQSAAKERDLLLEYQFMNDASYTQKILDSYGANNIKHLKKTAIKYDPDGLFQKQQHNGFLLRKLEK